MAGADVAEHGQLHDELPQYGKGHLPEVFVGKGGRMAKSFRQDHVQGNHGGEVAGQKVDQGQDEGRRVQGVLGGNARVDQDELNRIEGEEEVEFRAAYVYEAVDEIGADPE